MTPAVFVERLIVDFCLPVLINAEHGKSPVEGARLNEEMRLKLGLRSGGQTIRYPVDGAAVYLDMNGAEQQVFFTHADARIAGDRLNSAVKAVFPELRLIDHVPGPPLRRRTFQCQLSDNDQAILEMIDPSPQSQSNVLEFAVRITALSRSGPAAQERN